MKTKSYNLLSVGSNSKIKKPDTMAKDKRKPFNDDIINTAQMLTARVLLIKGK